MCTRVRPCAWDLHRALAAQPQRAQLPPLRVQDQRGGQTRGVFLAGGRLRVVPGGRGARDGCRGKVAAHSRVSVWLHGPSILAVIN
jgi:hypothetical protein